MYSIEKYTTDTIALANSLVIKFTDVAIAVNNGLIDQGIIPYAPENRREWKYFMNLSGVKHSSNSDVKITVIELGEKLSLTKELLDTYTHTKSQLLENGSFYNELVEEYPNDFTYIHGCMYPVDIEDALVAEEGTILAYNTNYVETNEYTLIKQLEKFIKNYLSRWHIPAYGIVDELYRPAMLAVLYSHIPSEIMYLRAENTHTIEVHSFHLEHFFRSRLDIWDDIQVLKNKTVYWLYKNLPRLIKNIGKNDTLNTVIEKILTENEIGIGEYLLRLKNPEQSANPGVLESVYSLPEPVSTTRALNTYYEGSGTTYFDLETIVNTELLDGVTSITDDDTNRNSFIVTEVQNDVKGTFRDNQKTKMLEITTYELFKQQGIDLVKLILDYWVYGIKLGILQFDAEFEDPNDKKLYDVDAETAYFMALKLILYMTGEKDAKLSKVYYDTILAPENTAIDEAFKTVYQDGKTDLLIDDLKASYPSTTYKCLTVDEFTDMISDVVNYYTYIWTLDANSENAYVSGNIKRLFMLATIKDEYDILTNLPEDVSLLNAISTFSVSDTEPMDIDDILTRYDVNYTIYDTYDVWESLKQLIITFTGFNIEEYDAIQNITDSFKRLVKKLTSYTVQIFSGDGGESYLYVFYNNLQILNSDYAILTIEDAELIPIEKNRSWLECEASNFTEDCQTFADCVIFPVGARIKSSPPYSGIMVVGPNDQDRIRIRPYYKVEVLPEVVCGYDEYIYTTNITINDAEIVVYGSEMDNAVLHTSITKDSIYLTLSNLNKGSGVSHIATDWEISTDLSFSGLVMRSVLDSDNLTSKTFTNSLNSNTYYYARAKALLSTGYTIYSNVCAFIYTVSVTVKDAEIVQFATTNGDPVLVVSANENHVYMSLSGIYLDNKVIHEATDWEIASDTSFTNIILSSTADANNIVNITFDANLESGVNYYGRAKLLLNRGYTKFSNMCTFNYTYVPTELYVNNAEMISYATALSDPTLSVATELDYATLTLSNLSLDAGVSHLSTDWEIASDSSFSEILYSSISDDSNLLNIKMSCELDTDTEYYARAKLLTTTGYTLYSNVVVFNGGGVTSITVTDAEIISYASTADDATLTVSTETGSATLSLSNISLDDGVEHIATDWEIASDSSFSGLLYASEADDENLLSKTFSCELDSETEYCARAKLLLSTGYTLYTNVVIFNGGGLTDPNDLWEIEPQSYNPDEEECVVYLKSRAINNYDFLNPNEMFNDSTEGAFTYSDYYVADTPNYEFFIYTDKLEEYYGTSDYTISYSFQYSSYSKYLKVTTDDSLLATEKLFKFYITHTDDDISDTYHNYSYNHNVNIKITINGITLSKALTVYLVTPASINYIALFGGSGIVNNVAYLTNSSYSDTVFQIDGDDSTASSPDGITYQHNDPINEADAELLEEFKSYFTSTVFNYTTNTKENTLGNIYDFVFGGEVKKYFNDDRFTFTFVYEKYYKDKLISSLSIPIKFVVENLWGVYLNVGEVLDSAYDLNGDGLYDMAVEVDFESNGVVTYEFDDDDLKEYVDYYGSTIVYNDDTKTTGSVYINSQIANGWNVEDSWITEYHQLTLTAEYNGMITTKVVDIPIQVPNPDYIPALDYTITDNETNTVTIEYTSTAANTSTGSVTYTVDYSNIGDYSVTDSVEVIDSGNGTVTLTSVDTGSGITALVPVTITFTCTTYYGSIDVTTETIYVLAYLQDTSGIIFMYWDTVLDSTGKVCFDFIYSHPDIKIDSVIVHTEEFYNKTGILLYVDTAYYPDGVLDPSAYQTNVKLHYVENSDYPYAVTGGNDLATIGRASNYSNYAEVVLLQFYYNTGSRVLLDDLDLVDDITIDITFSYTNEVVNDNGETEYINGTITYIVVIGDENTWEHNLDLIEWTDT